MRLLVLTDETKALVAPVIAYAKAHPISVEDLHKTIAGDLPSVGDYPEHVVCLPVGYRCVYSHEMQPAIGRCRHLSISVDAAGKGPHEAALNEIAKLFGFKGGINSALKVWVERLDGDGIAVNLIQRVLPEDES